MVCCLRSIGIFLSVQHNGSPMGSHHILYTLLHVVYTYMQYLHPHVYVVCMYVYRYIHVCMYMYICIHDGYAGRILVSNVGAISRMLEVNTFCVTGVYM